TTLDLSQPGTLWRFHTAQMIAAGPGLLPPAQPNGPSSDVVLRFSRVAALPPELAQRFCAPTSWFKSAIARQEDAWDTPEGKGILWVQIYAPVREPHMVIQIIQTDYMFDGQVVPGIFTMYVGRLAQTAPPVFFGHGAANDG